MSKRFSLAPDLVVFAYVTLSPTASGKKDPDLAKRMIWAVILNLEPVIDSSRANGSGS